MSATREQRDRVATILLTVNDDPKRGAQAWLFTDELAALRAVLADSEELERCREEVREGGWRCMPGCPAAAPSESPAKRIAEQTEAPTPDLNEVARLLDTATTPGMPRRLLGPGRKVSLADVRSPMEHDVVRVHWLNGGSKKKEDNGAEV